MRDGLYQVTTSYLCAGFVVENGEVVRCAPILGRKLPYWKTIAVLVSPASPSLEPTPRSRNAPAT